MNRSTVWSVGIALGIAASFGVYLLYGAQQQGSDHAQTPKRQVDSPEERSVDQTTQVPRMQTELASVKAQLSAIKTHLATRSSAGEEAAAAEEEAPQLSPEEQRANEARAWKEHMAKVAAAFNAEPVDPQWASATSETVETAIKANAVIAAAAGDVQCRSQTCRVEITKSAEGDVDKQLPMFVHELGSTLPYGKADRIENSDGTTSLALYLSTQGPEAPARGQRVR
jgi:hypothetical protein